MVIGHFGSPRLFRYAGYIPLAKRVEPKVLFKWGGRIGLAAPFALTLVKADALLKVDSIHFAWSPQSPVTSAVPSIAIAFDPVRLIEHDRGGEGDGAAKDDKKQDKEGDKDKENSKKIISTTTSMECLDDDQLQLFPFADGRSDIPPEKIDVALNSISAWISQKKSENLRPIAFFVIGSADKRPLRFSLAEALGENATLAMQRGKRVTQLLTDILHLPNSSILTLSAGPSISGKDASGSGLAHDRAVRLCAIWG